jgi:hypothetical protein
MENLCPFGSRYLISVYGCSCAGLLCHRIKFFHLIHEPFKLFFFLKPYIYLSVQKNSSPETASKGVQGPAQASGVLLLEQLTRNCFQGCSGSCTSFRCPACSPQGSRKCCNEGPTRLEEGPSSCVRRLCNCNVRAALQ